MALRRLAMLKYSDYTNNNTCPFRWAHSLAKPSPPLDIFPNTPLPPQFILPESDPNAFLSLPPYGGSGSGSMGLMAVPRKKVSKHKRGIRNGPKALKPVPVIIRCKACGRVKLPHFFCCSGERAAPNE